MHTAERALLCAERVIYLTEMLDKIMFAEFILAERASEETAVIALFLEINEVRACEWGWDEDHENYPTLRSGFMPRD
jgi:hypothetical protein